MNIFSYILDTDDVNELQKIFDDNRSKIEDLIKQISECFKQKDFQQAKYYISKIKYFVNIEDKIKSKTFLHWLTISISGCVFQIFSAHMYNHFAVINIVNFYS